MRKQFVDSLSELARKDDKVILIVIDVGFSFIEDFAKEFPRQFINAGVTEQSAMGMAAGLALAGYKPYIYSMIPFVTMRNFEQLRNDVCYNNANVKIVGVRGSVHYKFLGFSHNIAENEDLQILAPLPNLGVHVPKDDQDVDLWVKATYTLDKPCYIRI
jgi:transketolase